MKNKLHGLFDEQYQLDKIRKQSDRLVKLQRHIVFEIFRKPLESHVEFGKDRSQGGWPSLMMFILILQRYYKLSDDSNEYAILDRLTFMRFLGLTVPDAKTIWNFIFERKLLVKQVEPIAFTSP